MDATNQKWPARRVVAAYAESAWAEQFPPILTAVQAARLLQVPLQTVYAWRSRGRLEGCVRKAGRHLRLFRDCLIERLANGDLE